MLHGEIKIGDTEVGRWTAARVRKIPATSGNNMHQYRCTYEILGMDGYKRRAEFDVVHQEYDGAGVLAATLILKGESLARREAVS